MDKFNPSLLQKIMLEIMIEDPLKVWDQEALVYEALKRQRRIEALSDII